MLETTNQRLPVAVSYHFLIRPFGVSYFHNISRTLDNPNASTSFSWYIYLSCLFHPHWPPVLPSDSPDRSFGRPTGRCQQSAGPRAGRWRRRPSTGTTELGGSEWKRWNPELDPVWGCHFHWESWWGSHLHVLFSNLEVAFSTKNASEARSTKHQVCFTSTFFARLPCTAANRRHALGSVAVVPEARVRDTSSQPPWNLGEKPIPLGILSWDVVSQLGDFMRFPGKIIWEVFLTSKENRK